MKRLPIRASLAFIGASALTLMVRCSEPVHECGKDISCGDPGALAGKVAPGPPSTAGADSNNNPPPATADAGPAPLCTPIVDGGNCSVSFTKNILLAKMGAAGTWGCAASQCHDPQDGTLPKIDVSDPATTYANLYRSGNANPYINPCSTDAGASDILGNLSNPSTAGDHMPKDQPTLPSQSDIDTIIKPWIACGAPFN